jgi:prepilin-type N-terminal cleavage/methylation domain-containing protein
MNKTKKSKGFTLIELMIVVAIIGILAAVAIPKFADLVSKSKEAAVKGTLGAVRSAVSIYYGDREGEYAGDVFTALTNGNKYMPAVQNVSSLGAYSIPKTNSTLANPGHTTGLYANLSAASGVVNTVATPPGFTDGTPLAYNSTTGDVWVNCTHNDTKAILWTSY